MRQQGALLKGRGASEGVAGSIISLLRNAQLEVELRQGEVGRETVRLKLGSLLQMIERRIDVTGKRVSESQEDVRFAELWRPAGALHATPPEFRIAFALVSLAAFAAAADALRLPADAGAEVARGS